jgi:hypothetical protein
MTFSLKCPAVDSPGYALKVFLSYKKWVTLRRGHRELSQAIEGQWRCKVEGDPKQAILRIWQRDGDRNPERSRRLSA